MHTRTLKKFLFIILISLFILHPKPVLAQDGEIVIGEGEIIYFNILDPAPEGWVQTGDGKYPGPLIFEIPKNGGSLTGFGNVELEHFLNLPAATMIYEFTFIGELACHNEGKIDGTVVIEAYYFDDWYPSGKLDGSWERTWYGQLYADGTGNGVIDIPGQKDSEWNITFPPENFCTDAPSVPPEVDLEAEITREYIKTTYGIDVWDSFGDDRYDRAVWSDQELTWLNDVLKELPPALIDRMAVNRIVRNTVDIDEDGNPMPSVAGIYEACDRSVDPHCDGSSATIRIFDQAKTSYDFLNDPDGEKQFKSTILHEMVHGMQYHKGRHSIYINDYSPLVENYIDATRQITDMEDPDFDGWNGWNWDGQRFRYTNDSSNQPPTNYGLTDPFEDMAESVKMYVYDPERLKNSSYERYYFIRDEMFGGVEYEDGVQKKP